MDHIYVFQSVFIAAVLGVKASRGAPATCADNDGGFTCNVNGHDLLLSLVVVLPRTSAFLVSVKLTCPEGDCCCPERVDSLGPYARRTPSRQPGRERDHRRQARQVVCVMGDFANPAVQEHLTAGRVFRC